MTRLVVEEGGKRRAFKVGDGVITVGSGAQATLKLGGANIAELHGEIVVHEGVVKFRPKPGVLAPKLGGKATSGEFVVPQGVAMEIGDAKVLVDPPEPSAAAEKPGAKPAKAAPKKEWERSSRDLYKESGLKPQYVVLLLVPVAIIAFFILKNFVGQAPAPDITALSSINRVRAFIKSGDYNQAISEIDSIPAKDELKPELQAEIQQLQAELQVKREQGAKDNYNLKGTEYLTGQLKNFEGERLQGKVDKPAVRVFLKRCAEFEKRWPEHPEIEWVQRMKQRYSQIVDMSKPPSYEDIEFEVKSLTWANPRDYAQALPMLNRWIETAQGDERGKGLKLLDDKIKERDEWVVDRMLEARHQYEKNQIGQAVSWLVTIICYCGDPPQADKAAEELIKFDRLDEHLRGYRTSKPDRFEKLAANPVIARWISEHPLDQPAGK